MSSNTVQSYHNNTGSKAKSLKDVEKLLKKLPEQLPVLIFEYLISLSHTCKKVFPSQSQMAIKFNCSRKTIRKWLSRLLELGLIKWRRQRGWNVTCIYRVVTCLLDKKNCKKLSHFFKTFKSRCIKFLCTKTILLSKPVYDLGVALFNSLSSNVFIQRETELKLGSKNGRSVLGRKIDMNNNDRLVSTPATNRATKVLSLTPWGKIRCRLFEDSVIEQALDAVEKVDGIKNRFGYFFQIAVKYSRDKHISLNDKRFNFLKDAYEMPDNAEMTFENENTLKGEKVTSEALSNRSSGRKILSTTDKMLKDISSHKKLDIDCRIESIECSSKLISTFEEYVGSPECDRNVRLFGPQMRYATIINPIFRGEISDEELFRLVTIYPFLREPLGAKILERINFKENL